MESPISTRQPTGGGQRHLAFLDVVRGVAILLVVGFHAGFKIYQPHWNGWWMDFSVFSQGSRALIFLLPFSFGWTGVAIFFAVSGFCIHLSHERAPHKEWDAFFLRRFFRIYPPYLLSLCFFAFLFPPTRLGTATLENLLQFGSHLFLIHNIANFSVVGINGAFWSIAVEVQLYLLYPVLLLAKGRLGWGWTLGLLGGIEGALRLAKLGFDLPCWLGISPFMFWLSWAAGAKLADDYLQGRPLFLIRWPLEAFGIVTAVALCVRPLNEFSFLFVALTTTRVIAGCLSRPTDSTPRSRLARWMGWVGGFSYSLYLIHQPFLEASTLGLKGMFPRTMMLHPVLLFFSGIALCGLILPVAWLFYRGVELKSVEWGKRFVQRRSRARTAVPAAYAR